VDFESSRQKTEKASPVEKEEARQRQSSKAKDQKPTTWLLKPETFERI